MMAKVRTTVTLAEEVLKGVKVRAARSGRGDSEAIEEMLAASSVSTCWNSFGPVTEYMKRRQSESP